MQYENFHREQYLCDEIILRISLINDMSEFHI